MLVGTCSFWGSASSKGAQGASTGERSFWGSASSKATVSAAAVAEVRCWPPCRGRSAGGLSGRGLRT